MKERLEQNQKTGEVPDGRRKDLAKGVARVVSLVAASFWLFVYILVVQTGYLSWTGLAVGAVFVGSLILSSILGWAGRKRLETVALAVHLGMVAVALAAGLLAYLWPPDSDAWRPYRFDDELAAIEAKRAVPDAENAARRYDALFAQMNIDDEPNFVFSGACLRAELGEQRWKGSEQPQAAEWFDSQSQTLAGLLEIGRLEKCRWPVQADIYDEDPVPYKKLRRSALLLMAAGNRDLGEGQVPAALTKYFCVLRLADHLHQQPSTIAPSFSYERDGLPMIRYVLVQSNLSDQDITQIAGHLPPAADPRPEEWTRLREHEKLHYMNLLGRLYERSDAGTVRFAAHFAISPKEGHDGREGTFPRLYWLMSMPHDPRGVRGIVDRYFARFDHGVSSERLPQNGRHEPLIRTSPNNFAKATCNWYRWWAETCFFSEQNYMQPGQWRIPAVTLRRGTWLVLGLRRYHDAHGVWPPTLAAISEYVPAEAFVDPTGGDAFVYVPEGNSFKLYSKGFNHLDEGGRHRYLRDQKWSEDDIALWPPPPPEPKLSDEELNKEMEEIYGPQYMKMMSTNKENKKQ